jgi:hypothetical protein
MFEMDFSESTYGQSLGMSLEDKKALSIMEESLEVVDSHYQLDLPFCDKLDFPNNRGLAERRLNSLKAEVLKKDADLHDIKESTTSTRAMLPRSTKVKVKIFRQRKETFGISPIIQSFILKNQGLCLTVAKYEDMSLNDQLLQGPDLTNKLIGVLFRFR